MDRDGSYNEVDLERIRKTGERRDYIATKVERERNRGQKTREQREKETGRENRKKVTVRE